MERIEELEAISDKIRCGEPVGIIEAIAAINYQEQWKSYRKSNVWWRRVWRWMRPNVAALSRTGLAGDCDCGRFEVSKISAEALQHAYYRAADALKKRDDCISLHAAVTLIGIWAEEYEAAEREQAVSVTDEMVSKAMQAYIAETGTIESRHEDLLRIDDDGMRAALEAVAPLLRGDAK